MWFRNLRLYRLVADWNNDPAKFDELLAKQPLTRCGSFDMVSRGWVFPKDDGFVHRVNGQWLLALGVEQKLLPSSIIRQEAQERAAQIEAEQNRKVGRKELRDLRDAVAQELLPKAFSRRRTTWAWVDPVNGWLAVDAGSDAKADEFIEVLLHSVGEVRLRPLNTQVSPTAAMTAWLAANEAPVGFSIDDDLELRSAVSGQSAIRYVRHSLDGIQEHLARGEIATKLGMTWNDRIAFVLTDKLQLKRLAFLDILQEQAEQSAEDANEQFDVDFALMAGELNRLFQDLLVALGGEAKPE